MNAPRVVRQAEAAPAARPTVANLSTAAGALDADALWRRIEAHVAHRWSPRAVEWHVEGAGEWTPLLGPVTALEVSTWDGAAFVPRPVAALGWGFSLGHGRHRVLATVGTDPGALPGDAAEAFRRLAEYIAADAAVPTVPGASRHAFDLGRVNEEITRSPAHMAKALVNSGAADLLRPYRRY